MRRQAIRGLLAAALFVAVVSAARAADNDDEDTPPAPTGVSAWWNGLFGSKPKPVEKAEKKKAEPPKRTGPTAAQRDALMTRERNDNLRRLDVCLHLKLVAAQQNDEDLLRRVEELEEEINTLYQERTMGLRQAGLDDEPAPREKPKPGGARANMRTQIMTEGDQ